MMHPDWLTVKRGSSPLIVSVPHAGTDIPDEMEPRFVSPFLARKDADWYVDQLYGFVEDLGGTVVRTSISRSVIDVNRDPSGASLYPGRATTGLCPSETFDGETLYLDGEAPDEAEIQARRETWFDPYHAALRTEIDRLRQFHHRIVLFDAHSIRSVVPRLFDETLPHLNIGTNDGASCAADLRTLVERQARATPFSHVTDGRFKGGWITRHFGRPLLGVHAVQLELAARAYLPEPPGTVGPEDWPPAYSEDYAAPIQDVLRRLLQAVIDWAGKV
jgi:formiminoglutamase